MTEPSIDEFRRHLQVEFEVAELIQDKRLREQRLWQLEAALQEAIEFEAQVRVRIEEEEEPFQEQTSVRLLATGDSESEAEEIVNTDPSVCRHCDEQLDADVPFCAACGRYQ